MSSLRGRACADIQPLCVLGVALSAIPGLLVGQGMAGAGKRDLPSMPLPADLTPPKVDFVDVASQAGLTVDWPAGEPSYMRYLPETTGGGIALVDLNNDGLLDVFLVGTGGHGADPVALPHSVFLNRGALRFERATGAFAVGPTGWGQGVCAGDADADGYTDLFVTHWGRDVLLRNLAGEGFRDEAFDRGVSGPAGRWSTGCSFLDFDRDGDLDLFVAHYVDFDPASTPLPGAAPQCEWRGAAIPCGPRGLAAESMSLFENRDGLFRDVTEKAGVKTARRHHGLGVAAADYDGDGWTDVFVACDSTANLFFRNTGNGSFVETALLAGAAYDEDGREQAGMGVAVADADGDGSLDVFQTNFAADTNTLYRNRGDGRFRDSTVRSGLGTVARYVGWGSEFLDVDHDGWPDILVANGHVAPGVESGGPGETFAQPRQLFWNLGGGNYYPLSDVAGPGIAASHPSRGSAVGDLDNDGDLEIVVANIGQAPSLLHNRAEGQGNWLIVRVLSHSGGDAIGARVAVTVADRTLVSEVRSGGSYLSQGDFRLHFGLGNAESATVSVRWTSGIETTVEAVPARTFLEMDESVGSSGGTTPFAQLNLE